LFPGTITQARTESDCPLDRPSSAMSSGSAAT
jgi:hypothetical protein